MAAGRARVPLLSAAAAVPLAAGRRRVALTGRRRRVLRLALIRHLGLVAAVSPHRVGDQLDSAVGQVHPVLARGQHAVRGLLVGEVVAGVRLLDRPAEVIRHALAAGGGCCGGVAAPAAAAAAPTASAASAAAAAAQGR